jgi:hypothetical protein
VELSERMGYLLPGGVPDKQRAAKWFVEWWRNSAGEEAGLGGTKEWGWGLDCQWESVIDPSANRDPEIVTRSEREARNDSSTVLLIGTNVPTDNHAEASSTHISLEKRFCQVIDKYLAQEQNELETVSNTQIKKRSIEEEMGRREQKRREHAKKRGAAKIRTKRR